MRQLFMRQKAFTLRGNFSVSDENEQAVYFIEGSFMEIPKRFTISDVNGQEIAMITKKPISLLATFYVDTYGEESITIKQEWSFFKSKYSVIGAGIDVQGNLMDMEFDVLRQGKAIGQVQKKWFTWGNSYVLSIYDESFESILVSLVVAINYVKMAQAAAASGGS